MNAYAQSCNDVRLGIKAYQNIFGSLQAFERILPLIKAEDHLILSSIFCFAVVKYAKPFIDSKTASGKARYPIKQLKKEIGFSDTIHTHLIELRNTLIAHDDLESIEPKILQFCLSVRPTGFNIPVSIAVSNKCLAYPVDDFSIKNIIDHVATCVQGVLSKFHLDLARMRDTVLNHPEQAAEAVKYQNNYGSAKIEETGTRLSPPDFMNDSWLNSNEPDFKHIHNALRYEELRIKRNFYGPERIKLPDGYEIEFSLPNS